MLILDFSASLNARYHKLPFLGVRACDLQVSLNDTEVSIENLSKLTKELQEECSKLVDLLGEGAKLKLDVRSVCVWGRVYMHVSRMIWHFLLFLAELFDRLQWSWLNFQRSETSRLRVTYITIIIVEDSALLSSLHNFSVHGPFLKIKLFSESLKLALLTGVIKSKVIFRPIFGKKAWTISG